MENVRNQIAVQNIRLTNDLLERSSIVHSLVDGIDATLVELAAEEIGESELVRLASELADQTFASRQASEASKQLLRDVFSLRAQRVFGYKANGQLEWVRKTGTRVRMLEIVESGLLLMRGNWDDVVDPIDPNLIDTLSEWAWSQSEFRHAVREAYRLDQNDEIGNVKESLFSAVRFWISGSTFFHISEASGHSVDQLLGIYTRVISFTLQTLVEQAIAILEQVLESRETELAAAVKRFPEHLRFGVPSAAGCTLAAGGISHRRAYVEIGRVLTPAIVDTLDRRQVFDLAQSSLESHVDQWRSHLGTLVYQRTLNDLSSVTGRTPAVD